MPPEAGGRQGRLLGTAPLDRPHRAARSARPAGDRARAWPPTADRSPRCGQSDGPCTGTPGLRSGRRRRPSGSWSRRTSSGARAIISDVSARLAWTSSPSARVSASPPGSGSTSSGRRSADRGARAADGRRPPIQRNWLPKWPLTASTRQIPLAATHSTASRMTSASRSGLNDNVPGKTVPWPKLQPMETAGSTGAPVRAETAWQSPVAMIVSVPVGRCGPCCSVAPTGSSATSVGGRARDHRSRARSAPPSTPALAAPCDHHIRTSPDRSRVPTRETWEW